MGLDLQLTELRSCYVTIADLNVERGTSLCGKLMADGLQYVCNFASNLKEDDMLITLTVSSLPKQT